MPAKIGYSVPDLNALQTISSDIRTTGYIRMVISEKAWFIFIESATDTPDNINILSPSVGAGRWFKLNALVNLNTLPGLVEYIQDVIANNFLISDILNITYDDNLNKLNLNIKPLIIDDSDVSETAAINITKIAGLTTALENKAATTHTHIAENITDLFEAIEDRLSTFLVAGENISFTYNDSLNQLVMSSTGGGGGVGSFEWDTVDLETWDATY